MPFRPPARPGQVRQIQGGEFSIELMEPPASLLVGSIARGGGRQAGDDLRVALANTFYDAGALPGQDETLAKRTAPGQIPLGRRRRLLRKSHDFTNAMTQGSARYDVAESGGGVG